MTQEEQSLIATEDFYYYESRYRGYYLFDAPVPLEVPYQPFHRRNIQNTLRDDGRVPSLFKRIGEIFNQSESSPIEPIEFTPPEAQKSRRELRVLQWSFRESVDISLLASLEFLNMMSLSRDVISFEIVGTCEDIIIQLSCSDFDYPRVFAHLVAYFPESIISEGEQYDIPFDTDKGDIAIADFGIEYEVQLPIIQSKDYKIDPLTSIIAQCEQITDGSVIIFQVLFQGVQSPISRDLIRSLDAGNGSAFFPDNPELLDGVKQKIDAPLLSCVMRIACQGETKEQSRYLAEQSIASIERISLSSENGLVALSNEGYDYHHHVMNIFYRQSNRLGMLLNTKELASFVHYPNKTIVSEKLRAKKLIGKQAPDFVIGQKYYLGINDTGVHQIKVSLSDEQRLSHTHVIGATGTGKSTLLANMFLRDVESGGGAVIFDPHGDIIDDIFKRIPKSRKDDVIILDPSDLDFPIGFNLLHAETEAEKLVLSSDLVSAFRSYATSWGDRMTSVLANVIDTFLESERGGTLMELKRFLLEKPFRDSFLKTVKEPQLLYYWEHEFSLVNKASLSPLLTRIDTFLRPKIIRLMMAERRGLDLKQIVGSGKILLVKLSQGLIGKDNAHLLGSLLLSKLGQVALARQNLTKDNRHPFYIYMDEFQNIMTDSLSEMLSGVRKYGIGLILAHQDLEQLSINPGLKESVLSNTNIRICFRLGDRDAKTMETGFSSHDMTQLISLKRGEAIMRVSGASNDFPIQFPVLSGGLDINIAEYIISNTRNTVAKKREEVEASMNELYQRGSAREEKIIEPSRVEVKNTADEVVEENVSVVSEEKVQNDIETLKLQAKEKRLERVHEQLKVKLGTIAQGLGFRVVYEEETASGGRIDLCLHNQEHSIACEISVTNTVNYELENIKKCFEAGYSLAAMISPDEKHVQAIRDRAISELKKEDFKKISFLIPSQFKTFITPYIEKEKPIEKIINGYRVKVKYSDTNSKDMKTAQENIAKTVFDRITKKKK